MEAFKAEGNDWFKKGNYGKACASYTKAIEADPENYVLYSNRCAAFLKLEKWNRALKDAEKSLQLNPQWVKGYFRKAASLKGLQQYDEAVKTVKEGLEIDPHNAELKSLLHETLREMNPSNVSLPPLSGNMPSAAASATTTSNTGADAASSSYKQHEQEEAIMDMRNFSLQPPSSSTYSQSEVDAFLKSILNSLNTYLHAVPMDRVSSVVYLFAPELRCVSIDKAFYAPDTLSEATQFLREQIAQQNTHAAAVIVPKSAIAYPQKWTTAPKRKWRFGLNKDGIFVQLESQKMRKVYFIPYNSSTKLPESAEELDAEEMCIMAPLFIR